MFFDVIVLCGCPFPGEMTPLLCQYLAACLSFLPHFLVFLVSSVSSYPLHLQVCSVCLPWYWRESDLVWLLTSLDCHQLLLCEAASVLLEEEKGCVPKQRDVA